jgi:REP element-mobilizing transposase RayT
VERELKVVCDEIEQRYEILFLEIGADVNHMHFLVQSVPMYSPTKIVRMVKSLTARALFVRLPRLRKALWGEELWSSGYFISSVGKHRNEAAISRYVRGQGGGMYRRLDKGGVQESLFPHAAARVGFHHTQPDATQNLRIGCETHVLDDVGLIAQIRAENTIHTRNTLRLPPAQTLQPRPEHPIRLEDQEKPRLIRSFLA